MLKPASLDATHGFLLDGYPVEFIMRKGFIFHRINARGEIDKAVFESKKGDMN